MENTTTSAAPEQTEKKKWWMKDRDNWTYLPWAYKQDQLDEMVDHCLDDENYLESMLRLLNTFQMAIQKPRLPVQSKDDTSSVCYHKNFFLSAWQCKHCVNFSDCQNNFMNKKSAKPTT